MNVSDQDNQPRQSNRPGVESWFLRACAPDEPRAFWLKATTLTYDDGKSLAEAWCSIFDGDETFAAKASIPRGEASFGGTPFLAEIGGRIFNLDLERGVLKGELESERGHVRWDLVARRVPGELGTPLCTLPSRKLVDARFPKNKLLTPGPVLRFDGELRWDGQTIPVDGWWGSQGHNWGAGHAPEYAWGQVIFLDQAGEPHCYAEGATGRIIVGGKTSPRLSLLTVRRLENGRVREYRFDRLVDLWNQTASIEFPSWTLKVKGRDGEALISMEARPERMVCLGYENPNGKLSHCLNSKTSRVTLRVNPVDADGFECTSEHGGALEFLQPEPEPRVQPVI